MSEFELEGYKYRVAKLHVRKALHVARRLAPLVVGIAPIATSLEKGKLPPLEMLAGAIGPAVHSLADMPDKDFDFVIDECLKVAMVNRDGMWHKVWNTQANGPQFDDGSLTMFVMLRIVFEAIKESDLLNFSFATPPATQ